MGAFGSFMAASLVFGCAVYFTHRNEPKVAAILSVVGLALIVTGIGLL